MTPTWRATPGPQHLDLDALADLLAGEGTEQQVAHVGACAVCAFALEELDGVQRPVQALLAALPVPAMPPDLVDRLVAGLRGEGAAGAARPGLEPGGAAGGSLVVRLPQRSAAASPWLRSAAATVGVLVLVGAGAALLSGRGSPAVNTSTAGGSSSRAAGGAEDLAGGIPASSTGNDYRADGAALAIALPGLLSAPALGMVPPAAQRSEAPTRTDSDAATEGGPADPSPASSGPAGPDPTAAGPLVRLRDPAELAGCLSALNPGAAAAAPLALDYASFEGQPALVVVLPSDAPGKVDVFVVAAGCRAADDATLLFSQLPAPA